MENIKKGFCMDGCNIDGDLEDSCEKVEEIKDKSEKIKTEFDGLRSLFRRLYIEMFMSKGISEKDTETMLTIYDLAETLNFEDMLSVSLSLTTIAVQSVIGTEESNVFANELTEFVMDYMEKHSKGESK